MAVYQKSSGLIRSIYGHVLVELPIGDVSGLDSATLRPLHVCWPGTQTCI